MKEYVDIPAANDNEQMELEVKMSEVWEGVIKSLATVSASRAMSESEKIQSKIKILTQALEIFQMTYTQMPVEKSAPLKTKYLMEECRRMLDNVREESRTL